VNREIASEIDQHAALPNETFAAERKKAALAEKQRYPNL